MSFHTRGIKSLHGNERIWRQYRSKTRKDASYEHWKQFVAKKENLYREKFARGKPESRFWEKFIREKPKEKE